MAEELEHPDSFRDPDEPRSSEIVWKAICDAKREMGPYLDFCDRIDRIISASGNLAAGQGHYVTDQEFDLLWASLEILKPAVYCKPPEAVVVPRFSDRGKVATVSSEMLERCINSSFDRSDFDHVMLNVRDDLIIDARGVIRVLYEADDKGKRVCKEHVDRTDFLHEPARKWSEVGWVAFAAYMTEREYKKRFPKADLGQFLQRRDPQDNHTVDTVEKCKVWEVWHKADNKVYWVTEGVNTFLDEKPPFINFEGFFPCPRPAYGTVKRRTLIPVPDYTRFEKCLDQINLLTSRMYNLLSWIKVKAFIPAGGDSAEAVSTALANVEDDVLVIPVPGVNLMSGAASGFVQFLPIQEFSNALMVLLEARREQINNFYELSGISDIMRGATEAQETLGAQQLKQQNGSIRVREKIDELQRIARDVACLEGEIIAEKFDGETLLEMSQMDIPTKAELKKQIDELEKAAKGEMDALEEQAKEAIGQAQASGQPMDPEKAQQAEQQFNQAQQQITAKYQAKLQELGKVVPLEDITDFLRDQKLRALGISIKTDSTIMVDENAEKQSRGEFLQAFSNASATVQPLLMAGEAGAKLAGGMMKFALAPFRVGRELDGMIDDFVEAAPAAMAQQAGDGETEALAAAQNKLAEAEAEKAKAAMLNVQTRAESESQKLQAKIFEIQQKAANDQQKAQLEVGTLQGKLAEQEAKINLMQAQTAEILNSIGLDVRKQDLEEYRAVKETELRQTDQQLNAVDQERNAQMGERQQQFSERQGERSDQRADRQQTLAERQAQKEAENAE